MRRNWKFQQQDAARNHLEEHGIMKPVQDEFEGLSRKRRLEADVTVGANAAHGFSAAQGLKPQALPGSRLYPNTGFQLETPQPLHPHASQRLRPDEPHGFHLQLPPAIQQHSPHGLRPQPPHGYHQPHPGLSYTGADARRELIQQRAAHRTTVEKMEADHKHQQKTALAGQEIADRSRRRLTNLLLETRDMIYQAYMEADPKETRRMLETCGQHLEKSLYEEDDRVEAEIEEAS
jgi:hypothetical protein